MMILASNSHSFLAKFSAESIGSENKNKSITLLPVLEFVRTVDEREDIKIKKIKMEKLEEVLTGAIPYFAKINTFSVTVHLYG